MCTRFTIAVWDYFSLGCIGGETRRKCITCKATFSINSATTSLSKHAKRHGYLLEHGDQRRFDFSGVLVSATSLPRDELVKRATKQISCWIVSATLPFSAVEYKGFCELLHLFDATYLIPSRVTIRRHIREMCDTLAIAVRSTLEKQQCTFSLTADDWSSLMFHGYIVVSLHWKENSWTLRNLILDPRPLVTPHSGEGTALLIYGILEEWNLVSKIRAIATDNASDMTSGVTFGLKSCVRTAPRTHHCATSTCAV